MIPSLRIALPLALVPAALALCQDSRPSGAPLSENALRLQLQAYAHDSMRGRKAGTPDNDRATAYIAEEFRRIGLEPAGDNGSFFQSVPLRTRMIFDSTSGVRLFGTPLRHGDDFLPRYNPAGSRTFHGAAAVYGGVWGDTAALLPGHLAAGKLVVIGLRPGEFAVVKAQLETRFSAAAAIAVVNLDAMTRPVREALATAAVSQSAVAAAASGGAVAYLHVSEGLAGRIFGAAPAQLAVGATGAPLQGVARFVVHTYSARNVVAVLRGSHPLLRHQFVAIGSHNDHEGVGAAIDSDSLRAFNLEVRRRLLNPRARAGAPAAITVNMDSIRRIHPTPRLDSIYNGADDDGSGTIATIHVARALAALPDRPRRSILFVSHTAEEDGLLGSEYFTAHPTVALDSIVAHINLDMIGRGGVGEELNGGPDYLQIIGASRRSTELGALVEQVSAEKGYRWKFDYSFDAVGHLEQLFCRSDHYNYAIAGIPVVFMSTGNHADYHQVTDEASRVDYTKLARVGSFVRDLTISLANMERRVARDKSVASEC